MAIIAADKAANCSLKKLAEGLNKDTVIIHTPAEAVLKEILAGPYGHTPRFQWRDWYSWLTLLQLVITPISAVCQYELFIHES